MSDNDDAARDPADEARHGTGARARLLRNWWPPAILLATLTIASVLLFARVGTTDIELEASVVELQFTLTSDQLLTGTVPLSTLGVSGVQSVTIPDQGQAAATSPAITAIRFETDLDGLRGTTLALAPFVVPAGTRVSIAQVTPPREYRVSLESATAFDVHSDMAGSILVQPTGAPRSTLTLDSPRSTTIRTGGDTVDIDLTLAESLSSPFAPQLPAADLLLSRVDRFADGPRTMARRVSTIQSGTLFFESLSGEERRLRSGEQLRFDQSDGILRSIRLADDGIAIQYQARVDGMTTGTGDSTRSLMPSYLDWLRARHGLSLLWGSALYLFAIAAAALRWWGIRV